MASYKHVFSPIKIGSVEIKNRIEVPPMLSCMATPDGFVTREMMEFYGAFARGGAGIVTIGDTAVDSVYAKAHYGQLSLGDDRVVNGLSSMVEFIQKFGAKASIEINHPGRLASPEVIGRFPIAPSRVPTKWQEIAAGENNPVVMITEMDQDLIEQVKENYVQAAYRCLAAGFEMIMIHGGHGNLLSQFVSPLTNRRNDKYGGSLENRARFVIELLDDIRKRVGNRLAIEYRVSGSELDPQGLQEEDVIEFLKMIQDKIDLVNVSVGLISDPKYITHFAQPTYFPHEYNVHRAEKIKKALKIPVTCVGSISDLDTAERIIAEGKADIVAMGRAQVADPELVNKSIRGELEDIRPCLRCQVCGEKPSNFYPVRCTVNPVAGREVEYKYLRSAVKKRKIVIVGGGPAGMETAIIAAARGHHVTLFEKEPELGGALRFAAAPSFKGDMKRYLNWLILQTGKSGADVRLSVDVKPDMIKSLGPDILVVAVGAVPLIPDLPGLKNGNVVWAGDVDLGKVKTGDNVVVAGAGLTGCETALQLAMEGKKVMVFDQLPASEIARDSSLAGKLALMELLDKHGVKIKTEMTLIRMEDNAVVVRDRGQNEIKLPADTLVLALGLKPRVDLVKRLRESANEVYVIGDCVKPRTLYYAIHEGFDLAAEI